MAQNIKILNINNFGEEDGLMSNINYQNYHKKKMKLRTKFDDRLFTIKQGPVEIRDKEWFNEEGRKEYRVYLHEMMDLMFKPKGDFHKFSWDIRSKFSQLEKRWTGKPHGNTKTS